MFFYCPFDRADQEPYILPNETYRLKEYVECCDTRCCTKVRRYTGRPTGSWSTWGAVIPDAALSLVGTQGDLQAPGVSGVL